MKGTLATWTFTVVWLVFCFLVGAGWQILKSVGWV